VAGGPAVGLTSVDFNASVKDVLTAGGVMTTHCAPLLLKTSKARMLAGELEQLFETVSLHTALVPEFELTQFGFLVCSDTRPPSETELRRRYDTRLERSPAS
jgi:spermidine synthase